MVTEHKFIKKKKKPITIYKYKTWRDVRVFPKAIKFIIFLSMIM